MTVLTVFDKVLIAGDSHLSKLKYVSVCLYLACICLSPSLDLLATIELGNIIRAPNTDQAILYDLDAVKRNEI